MTISDVQLILRRNARALHNHGFKDITSELNYLADSLPKLVDDEIRSRAKHSRGDSLLLSDPGGFLDNP